MSEFISKDIIGGEPGEIESYGPIGGSGRTRKTLFGERPDPRPGEVRNYKELSPLKDYEFEHDGAIGNEAKFKFIKHIDDRSFRYSCTNTYKGNTREDIAYYTDCGLKTNPSGNWNLFNWVKELS